MLTTVTPLSDRATSSFGISIGTALALETLFTGTQPLYDPDRKIPDRVDITAYQEFWINLNTLYRNLVGSVGSAAQATLLPGDILHVLEQEVDLIKELIDTSTHGRVKPVFYASQYAGLESKHPHARLRTNTTEKQKDYARGRTLVIDEYMKRHKRPHEVVEYERGLKPTLKAKCLLLTHDAYDLLSAHRFSELDLIESHTGLLRTRASWYWKFSSSAVDCMRIPMNAAMLQVFGDSQHFFAFPIAARSIVLSLAESRQWTAVTTKERLLMTVDTLKDRLLAVTLAQMLKE